MIKTIKTVCDRCDSEYEIIYTEGRVMDTTNLVCPFCGEDIEELEEHEDLEEEYQTDIWSNDDL